MGCEAEKAINRELSSHLSEMRLEGTAISAVDFSNPCYACGNKKRRCLQPPTTFRKKVLIVEDEKDSNLKPLSCSDPYEEPEEDRKEQSDDGCGGECTLCRHCSCKSNSRDASGLGLTRSSSFVTLEKTGGFGDGSYPSGGLSRTTSLVTEDKGVINDGRLSAIPVLFGKNLNLFGRSSLSPSSNDGSIDKDSVPDSKPAASRHLLERNGSISTTAANDEILVRTGSQDLLSRNGCIFSLITSPPIRSSSVVKSILPDGTVTKTSPDCFIHDSSPEVDRKLNPNNMKAIVNNFDYDATDVATGMATVLSIDYHVQAAKKKTSPSSGGNSAEKVKVSLRCKCGVLHKIIFGEIDEWRNL
ncbi:hypothetical protein ZOSMA_50G00440 [Zostera marina]|uniref:Uncharacterized protein n=1 Tax=Zostera marina TaxID=29655 RepID=A0A0K9NY18_ZOSMR|nr:hypothetical protein ZOSMA_50G00440 [Zostera marina]